MPQPSPSPEPNTRRESPPLRRAAARAEQKSRSWLIAVATVVAFIALAACVTGTWLMLADDGNPQTQQTGEPASPTGEPSPPDAPATRGDAPPLSEADLFGVDVIASDYEVLASQALDDCTEAVTEELAEAFAEVDCSQVVRATVISPDGEHAATVGVVNLAEDTEAEGIRDHIEAGGGGGFTALRADGVSQDLGFSPTVLGYNTYGHYLLYTVVGHVDGDTPSSDDEAVAAIVADLVDTYLIEALTEQG